jgi:hydroxymethylpyrimidine pyrophosphatase-like HAD family hydrolase|tara:strand:- start:491 stop:853 length:363 start_codon:yes stop_codon:yes gene_type:complete
MKTIICDIDGTIFKYVGGMVDVTKTPAEPLPNVVEQLNKWELQGCRIIIITGRRESMRRRTEEDLQRFGIPYDLLLMGYADTGRVIINDEGSRIKAHAVSLKRNVGFKDYDWEEVGLKNI